MSGRAPSASWSIISAARAPRLTRCPRLPAAAARRGPARICPREEAAAELKAARALGVQFVALGEPDYPLRLQMIDDAPPLARGARQPRGAGPAAGRHRRLAQRLRRRRQVRAVAGARTRRGRLRHRLGSGARHRRRRASREPRERHGRGAGRRPSNASIRPNTPSLPKRSWRKASRCRKCRSPGSRARATFPAATG